MACQSTNIRKAGIPASSTPVVTAGGINNGQPFANFITNAISLAGTNILNGLPNGFGYFGSIGQTWDVALQAAAADSTVSIIQRPRIQTSQAKAAQFFVGNTVPYVNSVYYNSGVGTGASSSYSQLSVGVELDVTPFINPDGLVVMDINQEIDDINGYTVIQGVGNVPNTDKRTLQSEIAVKDRDTIILGGFVRSGKEQEPERGSLADGYSHSRRFVQQPERQQDPQRVDRAHAPDGFKNPRNRRRPGRQGRAPAARHFRSRHGGCTVRAQSHRSRTQSRNQTSEDGWPYRRPLQPRDP